ncbi:MAG: hypothetical protein A2909_01450 [Candidatus Tagabacteria bacterium RIFCSPLOWO2_01_FULL_39_11]|uniref:Uncharacterized protein n=1 Tax=Candidatus Tagabacteria bacterium RIFCSPLOWO2_01_FULL_39_11 TaxID=1802295 RepID=A0A1G2LNM7_9BACT|nr:MAG: hypothetical protein A2909_01450 [Candidatus Tagabacteria bacterium RIFCSPLOWO2_01_FULL_39_11]
MKKISVILVSVVFLIMATSNVARAEGFLFGLAAGVLLGGGDNASNSGAMIIYTMSHVSERVKDFSSIRFSSTPLLRFDEDNTQYGARGKSIYNLFKNAEPNADNFEILQVVRVFDSPSNHASLWFAYIEKSSVLPLKK